MQAYELVDLAINAQLRVDTSWLLFLTINSTIIGGVILIQRTFSLLEKSVTILIYLIVIGLNYMTTINAVRLLGSIYSDLGKFDFDAVEPGYDVLEQIAAIFNNNVLWSQPQLITGIYIGGLLLSVAAITFDEKLTKTKIE